MLLRDLPINQQKIIKKVCLHQIKSLKRLQKDGIPESVVIELRQAGFENPNMEMFKIIKTYLNRFRKVRKKPHLVLHELDEMNIDTFTYILTHIDSEVRKKYPKSINAIYKKLMLQNNEIENSSILN